MDSTEILKILELFNEKAEKLDRSSFTKGIRSQDSGLTFTVQVGQEAKIERHGPEEESIGLTHGPLI